jgi:hypothetical protein
VTRRYWMLVASLPALPPLGGPDPAPIGRERLMERLRLLDEPVRPWPPRAWAMLDALEDGVPVEAGAVPAHTARAVDDLRASGGEAAAAWLQAALARARLASALRRQRSGAGAPGGTIGWRPWDEAVRRRWAVPRFGLSVALPWLAALDAHLTASDAVGAQAVLDGQAWASARRLRDEDRWGFGDVFGWTQQWRLVERRRRDGEADAARVLRRLVEAL